MGRGGARRIFIIVEFAYGLGIGHWVSRNASFFVYYRTSRGYLHKPYTTYTFTKARKVRKSYTQMKHAVEMLGYLNMNSERKKSTRQRKGKKKSSNGDGVGGDGSSPGAY